MVRYYVAGGKLISQALEPEILAKTSFNRYMEGVGH